MLEPFAKNRQLRRRQAFHLFLKFLHAHEKYSNGGGVLGQTCSGTGHMDCRRIGGARARIHAAETDCTAVGRREELGDRSWELAVGSEDAAVAAG